MRALKGDELDPKGLIGEAYKMEGITGEECRSIFLDWALSYEGDSRVAIEALVAKFGDQSHPMTEVLREGQAAAARPRRRGGWKSRNREA